METINVGVLVYGGGMSGMACAAFATEAGAKTLIAEKQTEIGGPSNYPAGMFWGPQTYDKLRYWVLPGDVILQKAWMKNYLSAVQWMRDNGVPTAKRFDGIMTIGTTWQSFELPKSQWVKGYRYRVSNQNSHLHDLHQNRIRSSHANALFTNTSVLRLIQKGPGVPGSTVIGAITCQVTPNSPSTYYEVQAELVVLATGGLPRFSRYYKVCRTRRR
ncbi:hypothetical protein N7499_001373 [Penicillium canescens]|uniref:FAD-dependent oxidoreductase 2 FAD-binding domain-containing protein n=1 Tax=Penicillium canescens TaxID=5083 RepID=A0AAD6N3Z5_PENCN|nr:uncharacterized protein N7446_003485 [Penicillium canescens]KAJ6008576.1 hypothetical protein N7522_003592 [Penicillium canescens]KAJ6027914.1 hypothetical protein N7460_012731 [Penicillium canescens]KAJ6041198.1 hypothetical protein N7444_010103 [Penicillium canescens]KAJ6066448.1 hypothetical protein N7446_003485 [Penicillium canescens]KAJ6101743.1 hypothetical protein N7499_001373 [Penicillium canescens]